MQDIPRRSPNLSERPTGGIRGVYIGTNINGRSSDPVPPIILAYRGAAAADISSSHPGDSIERQALFFYNLIGFRGYRSRRRILSSAES
jgi:hypothetical protein